MQDNNKRSFTVPVLLLIIVTLAILCILFYSKNLLSGQNEQSEAGKRLAEKYVNAQAYAALLQGGAEQLLNATSEIDRLHAKEKLGEARFALGETQSLIADAIRLQSGQSDEQIEASLSGMNKALGAEDSLLNTAGEHDGPLTESEKTALTAVVAVAKDAEAALKRYLVPSGVGGYRIMADGGEWIDAVMEAKSSLDALAVTLSEPNLKP
ncbi:hypothetical protein [Cohnella yongneupensis]|uniref:Uncharacterized protein n=1 Tax=Cohnella yongneupensis TaxID=425006 RepID=A0ABW0R5V3_9BACL